MTKKELLRIAKEQAEKIAELTARIDRLEEHLKMPWDGPFSSAATNWR